MNKMEMESHCEIFLQLAIRTIEELWNICSLCKVDNMLFSQLYFNLLCFDADVKVIPTSVDTDAYKNASDTVGERLKMNFQILLNKHPSGIWCSELPNLYQVMK
jgi:hypothetical protein